MQLASVYTSVFEICILWLVFYQLYRSFKDSRGAKILMGLLGLVIVGGFLLELFHATVLKYMLSSSIAMVTLLAIVFQPELRTALAKLGNRNVLKRIWNKQDGSHFIELVEESVDYLVSKRFGALIVICRNNKLESLVSNPGVMVDALFSRELVGTIFHPKTLLHDGAVIVNNERIVSAGAILPVSAKELKDRSMGLRHRAGIGVAEESDAVVIIVSEETGAVSLAVGNMVERNVDNKYLSTRLNELLYAHVTPEQMQEISDR